MKNTTLIPAFAVIAALLVNGCSGGANKGAVGGAPVLVAQAVATNVPVQIDPPPVGHVTAYSMVTIRSQIGGIISQVHFQQGQEVKKGDSLFTIDPRPSEAALAQARANLERDSGQLEYAKANYSRDQKLFDAKIISPDQLGIDKASLDAATGTVAADEAAITNAILNLGYCQIDAPIDGVTGGLQFYQGNVVKSPDDILLTINQIHPIYVEFAVPEQYLPVIQKEMNGRTLPVHVTFANLNVPSPQGELTFVNNTVDEATGTIQLRATFPNEDNVLWPGQFVQVVLTLSELINAVVVPTPAVQTGQNGEYIYVVKSDQTIEERAITIGHAYQGETVVTSGLKAGETVVTDGQLRLTPGVKVNVKSSLGASPTNAP